MVSCVIVLFFCQRVFFCWSAGARLKLAHVPSPGARDSNFERTAACAVDLLPNQAAISPMRSRSCVRGSSTRDTTWTTVSYMSAVNLGHQRSATADECSRPFAFAMDRRAYPREAIQNFKFEICHRSSPRSVSTWGCVAWRKVMCVQSYLRSYFKPVTQN